MRLARSISELRSLRASLPEPVGFVPTMGSLHEGHLSLVRCSHQECASTAASIFVNPTQFAPSEDLSAYPRDLDRDLSMLEKAGANLVFAPVSDGEMYPPGYATWVTVSGITERLEGASRPTHFRGVTTVVAKLFSLVRPQRAYFGQKDAQQALVIDRLIADLDFDIELVVAPTVREPDGLAMSSRNTYLSPAERRAAPVLRRALDLAESLWRDGERSAEEIRSRVTALLRAEPLARVDYASVADPGTLEELETISPRALVSLAVRIGKTRLIDNTVLPPGSPLLERRTSCS
ncbi:MAG: pantoate--beta-alanine ligase [Candidatus Bipolaricaulota bacterium]|nr:pantoate--beta-alanine ligase [Candidatus Bipolaricaulota bacterium]